MATYSMYKRFEWITSLQLRVRAEPYSTGFKTMITYACGSPVPEAHRLDAMHLNLIHILHLDIFRPFVFHFADFLLLPGGHLISK